MGLADIKSTQELPEKVHSEIVKRHELGIYVGQFIHRKKNGELINVDISGAPIIIDNVSYILVVAIDVTEKMLQEQRVTREIINALEDDRFHIGSELHDNVCQILATSLMTVGMLQKFVQADGNKYIVQTREYITLALTEIRNLSHRLAPANLNSNTLEETLFNLFNGFNVEHKYNISLHIDNALKTNPPDPEIRLNIYRILQEQLRNIQKHAEDASSIEVSLSVEEDTLKMEISDNGACFNPFKIKDGIGFSNMKRRAELFSGSMEINQTSGKGCKLRFKIPVKKDSTENNFVLQQTG